MISANGKKVVYLLGAGASFQALPIVGEMPIAFREQWKWIQKQCPDDATAPARQGYKQKLFELADAADRYGTIDTYARSLYLLKDSDALASLKLHLTMFFLLEQAFEKKDYSFDGHPHKGYAKQDQIDKRYMTWLAQLLDNEGKISNRVQILSWNYDIQVEHAVGLYHGLSDLSTIHSNDRFSVYPNPAQPEAPMNIMPALIHLNGIAGQAVLNGRTSALYGELLSGNPKEYVKQLFERYADYDKRDQTMLRAMESTFNFAWEDQPVANVGVQLAIKSVTHADVLVIVGYSFPSFNRTIDAKIIQSFMVASSNSRKRIHIQSPSMTKENFGHLFSLKDSMIKVSSDTAVDQFYLPPELFS